MAEIIFSGKSSEYSVAFTTKLDGAIVINDSVFERDFSRIVTDANTSLIFNDETLSVDEFLAYSKNDLDNIFPFNKKFSIIESTSEYKLIEFGKQVSIETGSQDCVNLLIFGYDEHMDSVIIDMDTIPDYIGYSYAITNGCFSLKLTGIIDKDMLSRLIFGCACAVYCARSRQIKINISVDSSLIFSREYN